MASTTKTTGLGKLEGRLRAIAETPDNFYAHVKMTSSEGVLRRKSRLSHQRRTAGENITIYRVHKGIRGRDIVALLDRRLAKIKVWWRRAAIRLAARGDRAAFGSAANAVGEAMVAAIKKGVMAREIAPVKEQTQKRKDREGLRPGLPPMVRTGQLLRSLVNDWSAGKPGWR